MADPHTLLQPAGPTLPVWRVRLLGDVALDNGRDPPTRLTARAAAALLARLALAPERAHSREEIIELLWPGVGLTVGRNRLRQVLATLNAVLQGDVAAPVLLADRRAVRVAPGALTCDATLFESAWRAGRTDLARTLYRGELMPGFFDEWIADERLRLSALADQLPPEADCPQPASDGLPSIGAAPAYLTRLYGREADGTRLRAEVLQQRLVTLVGPGGAGKTRLAAELASAWRAAPSQRWSEAGVDSPFDPVLFVSLVSCSDRIDLLQALATALGTEANLPALERALTARHALLVLDNFEHLVDAAADVPQSLLARLPQLHLLVTSRRVLGLSGERECVLGALSPPSAELTLADAASNPAVALFVDRACAARADFQLTPGNLGAVLGLAKALDGMPLALELAAARCRSLSPADMSQMLKGAPEGAARSSGTPALELLERRGTRGDGDSRQASMERVLHWSWQLLPVQAQVLLAGLTVFRSGCTAAAAAEVCGLTPVEAAVQLDLLASHSLLQVAPPREGPERYTMLEVIREFAAARLQAARAADLRGRLRHWLIAWAAVEGSTPRPARIEPELPNVHAAFLGAQADDAARDAMRLALALRDYWDFDGMPPLSQQALETALAESGRAWPASLRCDAHELLAYTGLGASDGPHALAHADAALALAGADPLRRGRCLHRRAWVCLVTDFHASAQPGPLAEALALALQTGDLALQARCLHQQGVIARHQARDLTRAEGLFAQAQAVWQTLGNQRQAHARLRSRAQCWAAQGLHERALASFLQCEQAARADGDWVGIIDSTLGAATALTRLRRWDAALAAGRECLKVAWRRHHAHGLAYALLNIGLPLLRAGHSEDAARLASFALAYWTQHIGPPQPEAARSALQLKRLARVRLDAATVDALWREGGALPVAEAVAIALRG